VELLLPHVLRLYAAAVALYAKAEPYRPDLLLPSIVGLVMCFFGGSYMTLIAAVEAYRMCGWESSAECISMLYRDFQAIKAANDKVSSGCTVIYIRYACLHLWLRTLMNLCLCVLL
jgi:hypothetical protein